MDDQTKLKEKLRSGEKVFGLLLKRLLGPVNARSATLCVIPSLGGKAEMSTQRNGVKKVLKTLSGGLWLIFQ